MIPVINNFNVRCAVLGNHDFGKDIFLHVIISLLHNSVMLYHIQM